MLKQGQDRLEGQLLGIVSLSTETQIQVTDIKGEWRAQQQQIKRFEQQLTAQLNDMLEDRVHEAMFPDRKTKLVLLGVQGAASDDARRKLTNILADVNCKVELLYAYSKPQSARADDQQQQQPNQKSNIAFEVRPHDLPAIYRAKGELRGRGYNVQQQMHQTNCREKQTCRKCPTSRQLWQWSWPSHHRPEPSSGSLIGAGWGRVKLPHSGPCAGLRGGRQRRQQRQQQQQLQQLLRPVAQGRRRRRRLISLRGRQQQLQQTAEQQPDAPPPKDAAADQSNRQPKAPAFAEPAAIAAAAAAASKGHSTSRKPHGTFAAVTGSGGAKRTGAAPPPSTSLPPSRSSSRTGASQQAGHYRAMATGAGGGQSGGAGSAAGDGGGGTGKGKAVERKGKGGVQNGS